MSLTPFQSGGRRLKASQLEKVYQRLFVKSGHQNWWPGDTPFEIIVGAILTQNTAWINVERAIANLKHARKLTPRAMDKLSHDELAGLIRPAGYFNVKARRLRAFLDYLFGHYGGSLPRMLQEPGFRLREKLLSITGIGPETADSILLYAGRKPFFVIDAYTKRIFSRHGLHAYEADYDSWQQLFMDALPRRSRTLYNDFHAQIVEIGKNYCRPTNPRCDTCPLQTFF